MVVEGRAICGRPCGPNNEAIILEDCNCVPSIKKISVGLNVRIVFTDVTQKYTITHNTTAFAILGNKQIISSSSSSRSLDYTDKPAC